MIKILKWAATALVLFLGVNTSVLAVSDTTSKANLVKSETESGQVFRMSFGFIPETLDVKEAESTEEITILSGLYEGLTRTDKNGNVLPGAARSWEVSADGLTYTFHLDAKSKWSNGDPVRASDFEFSWKRTLDPNLGSVSPYAYMLYYIKNAAEFNKGSITKPDAVGIKSLNDNTLQVTLEERVPYFLQLTSQFPYFPLHKRSVNGNDDSWLEVTNGPFDLAEWGDGQSIVLHKNKLYRDASSIRLQEVRFTYVPESSVAFSLYDHGSLDWVGKPSDSIEFQEIMEWKRSSPDELHTQGTGSNYYYIFNTSKAPYRNVNIRKALAMAIDREGVLKKVGVPFQIPAYGFVPYGIKGAKKTYRDEVNDAYFKEDLKKAKELLRKGMKEEGVSKLSLTIKYNPARGHATIASTIAAMWEKNLGVRVRLVETEWEQFLKDRIDLQYDVARAGWGADYNDPLTFLEMFTSQNGNNDTGWKSNSYDRLIKQAYQTADPVARTKLVAKAEQMLINEMVVMPLYYYSAVYAKKPYVQGVFLNYYGYIDYTHGYIEKK